MPKKLAEFAAVYFVFETKKEALALSPTAIPEGFQNIAEGSFVKPATAPDKALERASGMIFRNCIPLAPVLELPNVGNNWALEVCIKQTTNNIDR